MRLCLFAPASAGRYPWRIFWVLLVAAMCGYAAVLPYAFELLGKLIKARELPMSLPVLVLAQSIQSLIVFGLAVGLGLLLAPKVGIETPLLRAALYRNGDKPTRGVLFNAALLGMVTGVLTLAVFYGLFARYLPDWPSEAAIPVWKRLLACIYGAVDEELLLRLFLLALTLWIAAKMTRSDARATPVVFWIANLLVAFIFGAAHLPAAASITQLTPIVVIAVTTLNAGAGAVFGYLTWTRGLEAAMIAHFCADLIAHLVGPLFAPH